MKYKDIRFLINILFSYHWEGRVRSDYLFMELIDSMDDISLSNKEEYIDALTDPNSSHHERFLKDILKKIKQNEDCPIISLHDEADGIYLSKKINDRDSLFISVIKKIESFELHGKRKGFWFELFCIAFLRDFGIECKSTQNSNDKGIDIFGSYKTNLNNFIGKLIVNEDIYILGQAKYFLEKVDTPVIRKLVGDTIFIRFDEVEYIEIKHNAVHLMVFSRNGFTDPAIEFAKKNKIELFDQSRIAHLIANNPDATWSCLSVGN
ncbi:restriction endonuclease [Pantoea sp. AG1095]|uniref:restriction endonuclease n=1 Tax=Pantoea sp. AG1095 TaxID=2184004 RepID=UPI000D8AC07D|nr:restriction endonuclease [Pantoea sp. AG1095]PYG50070.1 restriction endonuclease [Pantoea sp. AG1095]